MSLLLTGEVARMNFIKESYNDIATQSWYVSLYNFKKFTEELSNYI
jgi:hypothetical protein